MTRTAEKVRSLVDEDASMRTALETLLEHAEETGEIEWGDVRDDISSGQWGRIIQVGVLVDGDDGFRFGDPDGVRDALSEDDSSTTSFTKQKSSSDDDEESSWSTWDKIAAAGSIGLFAGYSIGSVRNVIGSAVDIFLGPLDAILPFYLVVLVIATITGLYSTLLQANLMDMDKMGEYQARMKEIQEARKDAKERGDDAALEKIQEEQMEAMGDQMGMFKEQFRPMVWIMLITIPLFLWMYWKILQSGGGTVAPGEQFITLPLVGEVGWTTGVLGPVQAWIVWYFLCSMGFTQIIRKALNIQTTPQAS